jgi:hypothetical protein
MAICLKSDWNEKGSGILFKVTSQELQEELVMSTENQSE